MPYNVTRQKPANVLVQQNTGVGKSRFTVVRMGKDMQVMIVTIAKIDKS
jgi:predicted GTPase